MILFASALAVLAGCNKDNPQPEPEKIQVTDICGNTYNAVTIGNQVWMAENLKCNKYDTESEPYKAGLKTIPTSTEQVNTPYYVDATDNTKWAAGHAGSGLSADQIKKLGYLYNWAAVVGVADGEKQTEQFTERRQGICPNGWHVPTLEEIQVLINYIEGIQGSNKAGKHLKTTTGWSTGAGYTVGADTYGFAGLPSGAGQGGTITLVGEYCYCWTASIMTGGTWTKFGQQLKLRFDKDNANEGGAGCIKTLGGCVRCVRN